MVSLEKEISLSNFKKFTRNVYGVACDKSAPRIFLSIESAYLKMEQIKRQLESIGCLEVCEVSDLDCRPTFLKTEGGSTYSLLTLSIEY